MVRRIILHYLRYVLVIALVVMFGILFYLPRFESGKGSRTWVDYRSNPNARTKALWENEKLRLSRIDAKVRLGIFLLILIDIAGLYLMSQRAIISRSRNKNGTMSDSCGA